MNEIHVRRTGGAPEPILDEMVSECGAGERIWLAVAFELPQYWLTNGKAQPLLGLYRIFSSGHAVQLHAWAIAADDPQAGVVSRDEDWFAGLGVTPIALDAPARLAPVCIAKPWGQEVWYTGIERRGVASVASGASRLPLPWLLALAPRRLCANAERRLILLKILDPLPEPVFGDLYFELHQEKREVYVVTAVDRHAWPDGVGAIRFGFEPASVARYPDRQAFLAAYLRAVDAYRQVRRAIDERLDRLRAEASAAPDIPVGVATLREWLGRLPESMRAREEQLRTAMDDFTALRPLRVGDVVKVPHRVPHSLQHGVRTVEFQTPVYERLILSFAQKVLTQTEWDTEAAASVLTIDPPAEAPFPEMAKGPGWREERIVEFDDFYVNRITLEPGANLMLTHAESYALLMAVGGTLQLGKVPLEADEAVLLPAMWRAETLLNPGPSACVALLARPLGDG